MSVRDSVKKHVPERFFPLLMEAGGRVMALIYRGKKYYCPCCQGTFRKMLPGGVSQRENAVCPGCNAYERHRLLWLYLNEKLAVYKREMVLLHIAPEYVFRKMFRSLPNIQYVGAGIEAPFADIEMDITAIEQEDNSYDAIICNHVLEHVPKDVQAMRELHRVLKPGGWAILQVPLDLSLENTYEDFTIQSPEERLKHFGQEDHVRLYGRDYKDRLQDAGFTVSVDRYREEFSPSVAERFRLPENEVIYLCTKTDTTDRQENSTQHRN
ncbi:hypothetical protein Q31b_52570 [Novipirellula aureliae]|uniref:Methyltransferase type 11 domain-containing protein n=1 Tax=Novipirellula aureliae TaxID=2527966 RepID=A0A5C6DGT9_9BACT|nr:class I SAM-dependent methyltransferase [Novipirellula aureliae]TWU35822.1 hypothetical protein Q31b_52570 [Novipirellula aureliae]